MGGINIIAIKTESRTKQSLRVTGIKLHHKHTMTLLLYRNKSPIWTLGQNDDGGKVRA